MYKLPIMQKQRDVLLRRGVGYIYMTSDDVSEWKYSKKSINDTNSIPGRTLAPLYNDDGKLFHILYNDDPPNIAMSLYWGHTKGAVLFNGKEGLWLIHSSPRFPIEPVTEKTINGTNGPEKVSIKNNYFYPPSAVKFGQSFLCISLPASQMNALGLQLMYNRPRIYSSEIPQLVKNNFPNLTSAAEKEYVKKAPWFNKISLKSKSGTEFISYAKARQFNKELYSDWVAADLQSDMLVETWSNGAGELPSNCKNKFQVLDVKEVAVKLNQNDTFVKFKNSQDHSKWAVTSEQNNTVVCIGDINRMVRIREGVKISQVSKIFWIFLGSSTETRRRDCLLPKLRRLEKIQKVNH